MATRSVFEIEKARFDVVRLLSGNFFGLNLGCGNTSFIGKINVDVVRKKHELPIPVEVVASAAKLPFKDGSFKEIIFQEVLEHIPECLVLAAVGEIRRVLKEDGRLILTVPNGGTLNKLTDTAWWFGESLPRKFGKFDNRHRHYSRRDIENLFFGFKVVIMFTSGRLPWGSQSIWTINRILGRDFLAKTIRNAFVGKFGDKGAVLFAVLRKVRCNN